METIHPDDPSINRCYQVLFTSSGKTVGDYRHTVLVPPGTLDRSPCGTGTSAKLACLAADGELRPGEEWVQESLIGSRFVARYRYGRANEIVPSITGEAFVCGDGTLIRDPRDPFRDGIG